MNSETLNTAKPRIESLDLRSALRDEPPALDLVLPGMIATTVASVVGPGGVGKSLFIAEVGSAVAGGPDLIGMSPSSVGDVLYLAAEDPEPAIVQRLHALGQMASEEELDALESRLQVAPLIGQIADVFEQVWQDAIRKAAEGKRLVILDTIRRFHTRDENSSGDMAQLLGILEGICTESGCSILFVHHVGKGTDGGSQNAARGSSVLVDNVRGGQWNLVRMTDKEAKDQGIPNPHNFVKLVQAKANFGPQSADRWLERTENGILIPAGTLGVTNEKTGGDTPRKHRKSRSGG